MSGLILPARFRRQPQYPAPIDWGNPLTRGLVFAWNAAVPHRNAVGNKTVQGITNGGVLPTTARGGRAVTGGSGANPSQYFTGIKTDQPFSIACVLQDSTGRASNRYPFVCAGGGTNAFLLGIEVSGTSLARFRIYTSGGGFDAYAFATDTPADAPIVLVGVIEAGGVMSIFMNGTKVIGDTWSGTLNGIQSAERIGICGDANGAGLGSFYGENHAAYIWNRSLSDAEAAELTASMAWDLWKYPRRNWADPATGATGITGTSTATLADVTTSASAALQLKADSNVTLANVTTAGATNLAIAATSSKTLDDVTTAATAALRNTGASSVTLADVTSSVTGAVQIKATVGQTLADVTASADSDLVITAGSGGQLDNVTLIATGVGAVVNTGASATTLADVTGSGTGAVQIKGASNVTLADVSTAGATTLYLVAASSKTLDDIASSATGALRNTGAVSVTLAAVTTTAAGAAQVPAVYQDNPTRTTTARVTAARLGYATDAVNTARLGHRIDTVPTRRLGARTK